MRHIHKMNPETGKPLCGARCTPYTTQAISWDYVTCPKCQEAPQ